MEMNYCRRCGTTLTTVNSHVFKCQNNHTLFQNPSPTVGVFLFNQSGELLLSVRGIEPMKGMLDSFGGFIDGNESIEQALEREMREELQLEPNQYTTPQYLTSATSSYEYGGETFTVLSSVFTATLKPEALPQASDDVASIHTSNLEDIDINDIGNDDIKKAFLVLWARLGA